MNTLDLSNRISKGLELYQKARKIGIYWIHSYTEFNFDSLGSISRENLDNIGNSKDKF